MDLLPSLLFLGGDGRGRVVRGKFWNKQPDVLKVKSANPDDLEQVTETIWASF